MTPESKIPVPEQSGFGLQNLPYCVFSTLNGTPKAGMALGDQIIDLSALAESGVFDSIHQNLIAVFNQATLNEYIGLGKIITNAVRLKVQTLFTKGNTEVTDIEKYTLPQTEVSYHLPIAIGDYTDFYSSKYHAFNVGVMFRGAENALMPNYLHLPVGYHGRASSIVVSGTPLHRPWGQVKPADADLPTFTTSKQLDFELEMAYVIGKENGLGNPVTTTEAKDYVFGFMLFNDWSARDIQSWEYVPLGPFLGKNFGSSLAPFIVTAEALEPAKTDLPTQTPAVLQYLEVDQKSAYDIELEVAIQPNGGEETIISRSNTKYLYWSVQQQIAHHSVNGCNLRIADLYASGTISAPEETGYGSMLELTWRGTKPLTLSDGTERKFINDSDTVIMRAYAQANGEKIGFGEVTTTILPAIANKWEKIK